MYYIIIMFYKQTSYIVLISLPISCSLFVYKTHFPSFRSKFFCHSHKLHITSNHSVWISVFFPKHAFIKQEETVWEHEKFMCDMLMWRIQGMPHSDDYSTTSKNVWCIPPYQNFGDVIFPSQYGQASTKFPKF